MRLGKARTFVFAAVVVGCLCAATMPSLVPGETANISVFCKTISGAKGACLTIAPLYSAFASSEDLSVSDLRETAVKQVWPD